ncbi:uncharacterized protein DNG_09913 [Cephalotrichum gorgonifer]|uniref:Uncharacterized protein n=1 Tax=Cephalotrichum gorgonifer TaxID=2041049 RepID=A0AAE8N809_9PEZI|nr:uncharacterized protein DNG_09913 [Cephalotrichum gorgonifer]
MVVTPLREVVDFREKKEDILSHIQKLRLSYTYIDAGWWYQLTLPRLPSGRLDDSLPSVADIRDVGRYVAKIIADPRTLNKKVHVYNEVLTRNHVYDLITEDEIRPRIREAKSELEADPSSLHALGTLTTLQLLYSWGIRGDNTPEYADYLGYLDGKELYLDFEYIMFDDYVKAALGGAVKGAYQTAK